MQRIVSALLIGLGLTGAGWWIGHGLQQRGAERSVTVKGLAERAVKADLALWPIRFSETGDDLSQVQTTINRDRATVVGFLSRHGIAAASVTSSDVEVVDHQAQAYGNGHYDARFVVSENLLIRSTEVDKINQASQATTELIGAGVVLASQYNGGPSYLFNGINALKPGLIAEASDNARLAATQFAANCGCRLGAIVRADQGMIQILPRDKAPMLQESRQLQKTVRVVATVAYALSD